MFKKKVDEFLNFKLPMLKIKCLLTQSPYFVQRRPIWVLPPVNQVDQWPPNITQFWTYKIPYHFSHPFSSMLLPWSLNLFLVTLCKTKWDRHSFLSQWDILERNGHHYTVYDMQGHLLYGITECFTYLLEVGISVIFILEFRIVRNYARIVW